MMWFVCFLINANELLVGLLVETSQMGSKPLVLLMQMNFQGFELLKTITFACANGTGGRQTIVFACPNVRIFLNRIKTNLKVSILVRQVRKSRYFECRKHTRLSNHCFFLSKSRSEASLVFFPSRISVCFFSM